MLKGVLFIRWCSFSIFLELSLVLFHFVSESMYIILLVIFIPSMYISGAVALSNEHLANRQPLERRENREDAFRDESVLERLEGKREKNCLSVICSAFL